MRPKRFLRKNCVIAEYQRVNGGVFREIVNSSDTGDESRVRAKFYKGFAEMISDRLDVKSVNNSDIPNKYSVILRFRSFWRAQDRSRCTKAE